MNIHFGLSEYVIYVVYLAGFVAFLISVFRYPAAGLYYVIPLLPMRTIVETLQQFPLGAHLIDIALLGVLIGMWRRPGEFPLPPDRLSKVLLFFGVFSFVSLWQGTFMWNLPADLSFDNIRLADWKNFMIMPLLYVISARVLREPKQIKIALLLMCVSEFLVNRAWFTQMGGRDLTHFSYDLRSAGTLGYAGVNGFAAFEAQFGVILLALYSFRKGIVSKLVLLGLFAFTIYCILFAFSRGAYLGFLLGIIVVAFAKNRKILIFVAVLLMSWQAIVPSSVQERIMMTEQKQSVGTGEELEPSAEERVIIWTDAMQLIAASPIIGSGFNTYAYMHRVGDFRDTHNYYLKVMVETGIVGLVIFLSILWMSVRTGFRLFRIAEDPLLRGIGLALAAGMLCAVVTNFFGDRWSYLQVDGFQWVLMGCVARGLFLAQRHQTEDHGEGSSELDTTQLEEAMV